MKSRSEIDSKFRFVILASKRAKQLLVGAKPKIKTKSKNPIRIAQDEVHMGLVDYEIIEPKKEEVRKIEGEGFIGEEVDEGEEDVLVTIDQDVEEPEGKGNERILKKTSPHKKKKKK